MTSKSFYHLISAKNSSKSI